MGGPLPRRPPAPFPGPAALEAVAPLPLLPTPGNHFLSALLVGDFGAGGCSWSAATRVSVPDMDKSLAGKKSKLLEVSGDERRAVISGSVVTSETIPERLNESTTRRAFVNSCFR